MTKQILLFLLALYHFSSAFAAVPAHYDFVVAQDGSGNFKTVQEAINAVPDMRKKTTTIYIKKGTYKEKLVLAGCKQMVSFIGEDKDKTIITYDDYNQSKNIFGEDKGTSGSASFFIYGDGFTAENITFQNTAGPVGQAVAVWVAGDKVRFKNCRFLGYQDTLYTFGTDSRQYYNHCYIEGTVDFIFGASTAVFDSCIIFCKQEGYITAASTPQGKAFGYVFLHCDVTGTTPENTIYLGRPWRPYAKTAFLYCNLGKYIIPAGWHNWGNPANEHTAYYAEYENTGSRNNQRVSWCHQLGTEEAYTYSLKQIFQDWDVLAGN